MNNYHRNLGTKNRTRFLEMGAVLALRHHAITFPFRLTLK